jgi:hypothetical protein
MRCLSPLAQEVLAYSLSLISLTAVFSFFHLSNSWAALGWTLTALVCIAWSIHLTLSRRERKVFNNHTLLLPSSVHSTAESSSSSFVPHPDVLPYRPLSDSSSSSQFLSSSLNRSSISSSTPPSSHVLSSSSLPIRLRLTLLYISLLICLSLFSLCVYLLIRCILQEETLNSSSLWMAFISFTMALKYSIVLNMALKHRRKEYLDSFFQ